MAIVNYHKHSHISNVILPDSVVTNEDYCKRIKELGGSIISSCEHGTQGAYFECHDLAEKYGLKWRYVSEAYFVKDRYEKDNSNCHIILAAKTRKGIGDINEALSEANISGYYFRPRVDMELLLGLDPRDVFVTTACVGGIWKYGTSKETPDKYDWTEPDDIVKKLYEHFGSSMMLEVQYHDTEKQKIINRHIMKLYRETGIGLICGLDSHFITPEQSELRDQLLEAGHIKYDDESGWYMDYPDDDEVYRRFIKQGVLSPNHILEAMNNTHVFDGFEDVSFDKAKKLPTLYPELTQDERNEKYRQLIREKWLEKRKTIPRDKWNEYQQGIAYEVDTITSTNMSDYFLLDYEIVKRFKEKGGMLTFTGRGSAPSYYTNSLLGFSSIDRFAIPVTMYPDRFISKDRLLAGNLPDIDMNVGNPEVFAEAQAEIMGEWKSAPMIALGTLKRASAWKMYCRAQSVEFDTANAVSDNLKAYDLAVKHADEDEEIDVHEFVPKEYHELLEMSEKYLGLVNSISPHPCAYLLCMKDIRREIGIYRINSKQGKKGPVFAAFIDGATAEKFGYLKNDDLKVDVVKVNANIYKRIGIPQPTVPELIEMTAKDKATWEMYSKGYTLGLNQAEKEKSTQKVMAYKPKNISEMSAFVAGIRPGFQSMASTLFGRMRFSYGIPALDELLQTAEMPDSFILYQEQVMAILQWAGFPAPDSYAAIKAIAKKHPEKVLPLKEKFLNGFTSRLIKESGLEEPFAKESADKVWKIVEDNTGYSFNCSHSVSVALDSLYTAWAKAHHPLETYTELMSNYADKGNKERIELARIEMKKAFGIKMSTPKFRQDNRDFYLDHEHNTISDSLVSVKHLSKAVANELYLMRDNQYPHFVDLLVDMANRSPFDTRNTEILIRMNYFEEFGSIGKLLSVWHAFSDGELCYKKTHSEKTKNSRIAKLIEFELSAQEEQIGVREQLAFEIDHLGTPVSTFANQHGNYVVLDVDAKYSPKVRMYNIVTGTVGLMKIKKDKFKKDPVETADIITVYNWKPLPAYMYSGGKRVINPSAPKELWLDSYKKVA